jgi:hypothetical protein
MTWRERDFIFARLKFFASDAERLDAALQLLDLDEQGEELNDMIKNYHQTGKIEKVEIVKETEELPTDLNELWKMYRNDVSYIAKPKNLEKKQQEVERRKARILLIKPKIGL